MLRRKLSVCVRLLQSWKYVKLIPERYRRLCMTSSSVKMARVVCVNLASTSMTSGSVSGPGSTSISASGSANMASVLEAACSSLKSNFIIAVPTDTIYGIAGLAQSTQAVQQIYNIKTRDTGKPISICVADVDDIQRWGKVTVSRKLLQELLPGPVTVVFERTAGLNPQLNPGTSLVGIRVPDHTLVREITRLCGEPLALTSANVSKAPSSVSVQEFMELWPKLDLVLDGGTVGTNDLTRQGSTVVDLSKPGQFTIIRPGSAYRDTVDKLSRYGLTEDKKS